MNHAKPNLATAPAGQQVLIKDRALATLALTAQDRYNAAGNFQTGVTGKAQSILDRVRVKSINLIEDIDMFRVEDPDTKQMQRFTTIEGVEFEETTRLQTSVAGLLGASLSNLAWIDYKDMASRILKTDSVNRRCNLTYICSPDDENVIVEPLAVVPTSKDFIDPRRLVEKLQPEYMSYANGQLLMTSTPKDMVSLSIMGDQYSPSSFVRLPIDGYGDVSRFLGTLRALCSNGLVLLNKHFGEVIKNSNDKLNAVFGSMSVVPTDLVKKVQDRMLVADRTMISGREFRTLVEAVVMDRREARRQREKGLSVEDRSIEVGDWFESMLVLERNVLDSASSKLNLGSILKGDLDILGAVGCKATVLDTINMITELSTYRIGDSYGSNTNVGGAVAGLLGKSRFNLEGREVKSERRDFWFTPSDLSRGVSGAEVADLIEFAGAVNN